MAIITLNGEEIKPEDIVLPDDIIKLIAECCES